jgi:general stress protein YciG
LASTNPGNFANRDPEEVKAIASMGGKASHGSHKETEVSDELHISQRPQP